MVTFHIVMNNFSLVITGIVMERSTYICSWQVSPLCHIIPWKRLSPLDQEVSEIVRSWIYWFRKAQHLIELTRLKRIYFLLIKGLYEFLVPAHVFRGQLCSRIDDSHVFTLKWGSCASTLTQALLCLFNDLGKFIQELNCCLRKSKQGQISKVMLATKSFYGQSIIPCRKY